MTVASRNTLKQHFRSLIELGYLYQCGSGQVCGMTRVNLIASSVPEGTKIRRLLDLVHAH